MYLLEEGEEAEVLRQNVLDLLHSRDEANQHLACQIIQGGGFHEAFAPVVLALAMHELWDYAEEKPFHGLAKTFLKPKELKNLESICHNKYSWTGAMPYIIKQAKRNPKYMWAKYWKAWAVLAFKWDDSCKDICLKYRLVPEKNILESCLELSYLHNGFYTLYISHLDIEDLPDGMADMPIRHLNILNCPLTHIKRKKWQNLNVQEIDYNPNFPEKTKKILAQCFPNFLKKMRQRDEKKLTIGLLKAIPNDERNIHFYKLCAERYKASKNYRMALKIYLCMDKMFPYPEEVWKLKIAGCYALLKDKPTMLHWLALHIAETPFEVNKDLKYLEADFKGYRRSKDFKAIVKGKP